MPFPFSHPLFAQHTLPIVCALNSGTKEETLKLLSDPDCEVPRRVRLKLFDAIEDRRVSVQHRIG